MRPSLLSLSFDEIPTGLEAAVSPSPSCDEGAGCCCAACRRKASSSLTFSCLLILATLLELFLRRRHRHRRQDGCPVNLATFFAVVSPSWSADSFLITFAAARTRARDSQFLISPSSLPRSFLKGSSSAVSALSVFHLLERSFADQELRRRKGFPSRNQTRRARD